MARVSPSLILQYWVPDPCGRRIFLRARGEQEGDPDPFLETLARLGQKHEDRERQDLAPYLDLKPGSPEERIARTREALEDGTHEVLFQPLLLGRSELAGSEREIVGEPDFLVRQDDGWKVREVKLARRVEGSRHTEIRLQTECYGWLLEQTTGRAPQDLEIVLGSREILKLPYQGGGEALELRDRLLRIEETADYGYEPVGWSKCSACVFRSFCWDEAKTLDDVALVPELDQGLARELHAQGVPTVRDLLDNFDETRLASLERPYGKNLRKVGKSAGRILQSAQALSSGSDLRLGPLVIPDSRNFAMFDIEGIPPDLEDDLGKIFLWGVKVFGQRPSGFLHAVAGFVPGSDEQAWFDFLRLVHGLFAEYDAELPMVHWSSYEVGKVRGYLERYGDDEHGSAAALQGALFDLLPATKRAWALPLHSYSLKVVEKYAGYTRKLADANGAWAMARYIEAVESENEEERRTQMAEILEYNEEDLDATWQILKWLMLKEGKIPPGGTGR
jgi:predicted RecB family nuclease